MDYNNIRNITKKYNNNNNNIIHFIKSNKLDDEKFKYVMNGGELYTTNIDNNNYSIDYYTTKSEK